ncbi:MAG: 3,4-dihydroxy-2-butanone-4-phosphate synthase [Deltaproteobacteria bacterium]|nr:3,4-dihydroxy-2-butanone-4-phosphate synthase [Deltaproteobacteria bacterium]
MSALVGGHTNHTQAAIDAIAHGKMVILVDDEDRENEGDLVMAAELVTPEAINFMAKFGRGLICLTLTEERLRALDIPMMVQENTSSFGTAFTVSIEARHGVSTGISAKDRAHTIKVAIDEASKPNDLTRPGHVFPLRAKKGGVLVRTGQTEGSVDLARLAGCKPAGVICEIMNDDGTMARRGDLEKFAAEHDIIILTIAELIEHRLRHDKLVKRERRFHLDHASYGKLAAQLYTTEIDDDEHLALIVGDVATDQPTLVRVQTECQCGAWFGNVLCDCGATMGAAIDAIRKAGRGVFVGIVQGGHSRQTLGAHFSALASPQEASGAARRQGPTLREFGIGAQILRDLGLTHIKLLTNTPKRLPGLEGYGLVLAGNVPFGPASGENPALKSVIVEEEKERS